MYLYTNIHSKIEQNYPILCYASNIQESYFFKKEAEFGKMLWDTRNLNNFLLILTFFSSLK